MHLSSRRRAMSSCAACIHFEGGSGSQRDRETLRGRLDVFVVKRAMAALAGPGGVGFGWGS